MNKQFSISAMLAAVLLGPGISGTASALPEMQVGSRLVRVDSPANMQALPADSADAANVDDTDSTDDDVAQVTAN